MCEPLVLVDDTLGGGAKEGLLIGEKCVSFKSLFLDPEEYIIQGGFNGGFEARGTKILRMGKVCKEFVHFSSRGVALVCQALNEYFDDLRAWHRNRAESGDAESANFMSMSCSGDPDQALYWLRRAADAGLRVAQHNLARNLESRNPAEAFRLFKLAADQGCESSRERMRKMGSKASEYKEKDVDMQRDDEEQMLDQILENLLEIIPQEPEPLAKAIMNLCGMLIRITSMVPEMLEQLEIDLDDADEETLDSDIFKLEVLAYAYSSCAGRMEKKSSTVEATAFLHMFGDRVLATYCVAMESLEINSGYHGEERIKQVSHHSPLLVIILKRVMGYGKSADNPTESARKFITCLLKPALRSIYPEQMARSIDGAMEGLVENFFDLDTAGIVLGTVDRLIDKEVNKYLARRHGAR